MNGSPDHLISTQQDRLRYRDAKGFGGLEINDQLKFRGLLHRKISWFCALQQLIDEVCDSIKGTPGVTAIGHEQPSTHKFGHVSHYRQTDLKSPLREAVTLGEEQWRIQRHDRACFSLLCCCKSRLEIIRGR